jgi:xylan 1,4-beta-xylosidase
LLLWDYTYTLPDSVNNQAYYIRDLPSKSKGNIKLAISGMPAGKYRLEISQIGYRANDAYTGYVDMGRPRQLNRGQVQKLEQENDGRPKETEMITINASGKFLKELPMRENDVFLVNLIRERN